MGAMAVTFVIQNIDDGPLGVVVNFLRDALTNLAARFVYGDLVLIWAALGVFMIVEGRRYRIRHVWAYIVGAPALALAVSFPLFMYVRQLRIAAEREQTGQDPERAGTAPPSTDEDTPRRVSVD
ncbi:DUF2834 domain-containing protein [Streptomyces sp. OF3]|uniref:DUF2834 domain-containing protein n=2 Tax=Streptomyces alkaliterrae TaxID=2213162 RepID=A0A5P0YW37_9ACTN|nr:DUF2834 domain-containing protein [Streptomyces alkaliterrae]MBB1261647.1 DUF2834 domain-containing protein [Streptomyces alkaliterrae]MQS04505.1 DUF2834 domain-containing protein [Streptomyces alkaliterrae]